MLVSFYYVINPRSQGKRKGVTIVEPKGVSWDSDLKRWNAPFIMAGINTRIVARSAALLGREPFNYKETMSFEVSKEVYVKSGGRSAGGKEEIIVDGSGAWMLIWPSLIAQGGVVGFMQAWFVTISLLFIVFFMSIPPVRWLILKVSQ